MENMCTILGSVKRGKLISVRELTFNIYSNGFSNILCSSSDCNGKLEGNSVPY